MTDSSFVVERDIYELSLSPRVHSKSLTSVTTVQYPWQSPAGNPKTMDPLFAKLDASRLKGTSQGKKTDLPPSHFIRSELKKFGCIDTPPNYKADLTGDHLFQRNRFPGFSDERYEALGQSFRLATKLLHAARPYLCNFLPEIDVVRTPRTEARVRIKDKNRTMQEQDAAMQELIYLLQNITWQENDYMWKRYGVVGFTHTGLCHDGVEEIFDMLGGFENVGIWNNASRVSSRLGLKYRQMRIDLPTEFVDTIISSEPNTEQHMNAIFQAGITIVHELGHAIFYCHKKVPADFVWIGKDQFCEIGHSLIAWLFRGFYPEPIFVEDMQFYREFRGGHAWYKMPRKPSRAPVASVAYSMPMSHIQRLLSAESWAPYDFRNDPNIYVKARRQLLAPRLPFKIGKHARTSRIFALRNAWKSQMVYAGYGSALTTFEDEDWDDGESGLDMMDPSHRRKRSPDARAKSRRRWLLERSYSDHDIEEFLTDNPRFKPDPRLTGPGDVSTPRYTQEDLADWFGKKMGLFPFLNVDEEEEMSAPKKRAVLSPEDEAMFIAVGGRIVAPEQTTTDPGTGAVFHNKGTETMYAMGARFLRADQSVSTPEEEDDDDDPEDYESADSGADSPEEQDVPPKSSVAYGAIADFDDNEEDDPEEFWS
ncbi:hypothetical protein MMC26_003485 [Xylographa opegraphella]|nr:hypothetical protein [Xylographa opegraphella]